MPMPLRTQSYDKYSKTKSIIVKLLSLTRQLAAANLSLFDNTRRRRDIMNHLDAGQRLLGLEIIARSDDGVTLDGRNTITELYRRYAEQAAKFDQDKGPLSVMTTSPAGIQSNPMIHALHHLYLDFKVCIASICGPGEHSELFFSLYSPTEKQYLTEDYCVVLTQHGMPIDKERIGKLQTLFTELGSGNLRDKVFLVCRIFRHGRMSASTSDKEKPSQLFRRPFGCAAMDVSEVLQDGGAGDPDREYTMPIFVANNEQDFASLPAAIASNQTGIYTTIATAQALVISLQAFHGDVAAVTKDNGLLAAVTQTKKMGFPDVITPGISRNEMYVTLVEGDFQQGRKTAAKNIEVAMTVRWGSGAEEVQGCIRRGSGEESVTEYTSPVFYHNNEPRVRGEMEGKWKERVVVDVGNKYHW